MNSIQPINRTVSFISKSPLTILVGIYLILLICLLSPRINGNDAVGYYVYLRSAILDHDFDFANEFAHYQNTYLIIGYSSITGRPVDQYPIGCALLWLPFFLIAHLVIWFIRLFGSTTPMDGYSIPYIISICFGSTLYAFIGLILIYRIAIIYFSARNVGLSILLFWLASPLIFYMYLQSAMAHANTVFTVSLFLYLWWKLRDRNDWIKWALLGFSGSLMVLVRYPDILFLLIPLVDWLFFAREKSHNLSLRIIVYNLAIFAGAFILIFIPQLIAWQAIYGSYFSGPETYQISSGTNLLSPHIIAVLFSGKHGLFTWNPIIAISLFGIYALYKKDKRLTSILGLCFLVQLYFISCWHEWWAAHRFVVVQYITLRYSFLYYPV